MTQNVPRVIAFKAIICVFKWWPSCTLLTISFSCLRWFFKNFSNLKGEICIPKLCNKRIPRFFKSLRPWYLITSSIDWKTIPCCRNAQALIRLWPLCNVWPSFLGPRPRRFPPKPPNALENWAWDVCADTVSLKQRWRRKWPIRRKRNQP